MPPVWSNPQTGHDRASFDSTNVPQQQVVQEAVLTRADASDDCGLPRLPRIDSPPDPKRKDPGAALQHRGKVAGARTTWQIRRLGAPATLTSPTSRQATETTIEHVIAYDRAIRAASPRVRGFIFLRRWDRWPPSAGSDQVDGCSNPPSEANSPMLADDQSYMMPP